MIEVALRREVDEVGLNHVSDGQWLGQAAALCMQIGRKKEEELRDQLYLRALPQSEGQRGLDGITLVIVQISLVILFPCFDSCGAALQCYLRSQFCFDRCHCCKPPL